MEVPPLLEQTAIAAGLTDINAALSALEQLRDKTRPSSNTYGNPHRKDALALKAN